jgi:hypothetical protein
MGAGALSQLAKFKAEIAKIIECMHCMCDNQEKVNFLFKQ